MALGLSLDSVLKTTVKRYAERAALSTVNIRKSKKSSFFYSVWPYATHGEGISGLNEECACPATNLSHAECRVLLE